MQPHELTATELSSLIESRELSCEEVARSCLEQTGRREPVVRAWSYLDPELVLRNARELDKRPYSGPLHGIPIGVKDVIETADMPTTYNSRIYEGLHTNRDAACVAVTRNSGALVFGKTETVEFAAGGRMALTTNPHNAAHTPGGSSSGSAAAVAADMVPLSFGTQTAGSLIRPAAFNGVYGIKPTHGVVSRGAKNMCHSLDTIGWYGKSVDDLELLAEAFQLPGAAEANPVEPGKLRLGLVRTHLWDDAEPAGRAALERAAQDFDGAGIVVEDLDLGPGFVELGRHFETIIETECGAAFLPEALGQPHMLHPDLMARVERKPTLPLKDIAEAYDVAALRRMDFDQLFKGRYDAIITLPAPGAAPRDLNTVGSWKFNTMWTLLGGPCIAMPTGTDPGGMPLGIQLAGARFADRRLLKVAEALSSIIGRRV